ncbi:MAG TPA: type II secretion system F family protein [Phycisphaerales bacterium]|nr:type II secretion system F family protein [Phycisphaerales bacterium]
MATFVYKGVDAGGQTVTGTIEAVDRKAAIADLAQRGRFASELMEGKAEGGLFSSIRRQEGDTPHKRGAIRSKELLAMMGQLATALKAGLPIVNALEIIKSQQKKESMYKLLEEMVAAVTSGDSLSEAMERRPELFDRLSISMVRVGETGGILEQTVDELVKLKHREEKVKSNLINAAAYPIFVLTVGLISMVIILVWVLPKIITTIGIAPAMLPLPTRMLMGLSHFLVGWGWACAIAIAIAAAMFNKWKQTPDGRFGWDGFMLRLPLFGPVVRTLAVGRFARTLGALTKSGVTILEALRVVRDTLGNEVLGRQIDQVSGQVKTGHSLAEPLESSGMFPALLVQIVAMGEQTGRLDELLLSAADTFDETADTVMNRFLALFPAILILLLAVAIFFIIVATLLPIVGMDLSVL